MAKIIISVESPTAVPETGDCIEITGETKSTYSVSLLIKTAIGGVLKKLPLESFILADIKY